MDQLENDYLEHGRFMTPAQRNEKEDIYDVHVKQAVRRIRTIESERLLLKGHFSKVAKEYHVKVTDLKKAYNA